MNLKMILLIGAMVFPLLAGCWNRIEINDIAIVTAIGLDRVEAGNIRLSTQIGIPTKLGPTGSGGGSKNGNGTFVISETGETIADAYRKLQEKIARQLFISHSRVLIIGEKLARDGMSEIVDFFARYQESRILSPIMVTNGEAERILKTKAELESVPAEETKELNKLGIDLKVSIKDFWEMLITDGIEPVAPQIILESLEAENGTKSPAEYNSAKNQQTIRGVGIFKKDKLIGWMDEKDTRGILWLQNSINKGIITVNIPKKEGGGRISSKIIRSSTDVHPIIQGDNLKIAVNIRSETVVVENSSKMDLNDSKKLILLQKYQEEDIKNRIQSTLNKVQKQFRSDIFGFGRSVYRAYPKEWNTQYKEKWDEEFPKLDVSLKPKVIVKEIGFIKKAG